ncbi:MAG TPA: hypothetical protein VFA98_06265 [Thermoanaerobaculia bacterium]|jgi:hypothetical protein|nr:hypothetical protein [Thermoanaerobaculia bacterium]
MSREIKRVALDFEWPLEEIWKGYINPHFKRCPADDCRGGETAASTWVFAVANLIAMLGEQAASAPYEKQLRQRGQIYPHPYLEEWAFAPRKDRQSVRETPALMPFTEELLDFASGLAGKRLNPGHLNGNPEVDIYKKLLKAAGIERKAKGWGVCKVCDGTGCDPATRKAYESWKPEEPPAGPGWQLWETVSEGSPISPVFVHREMFVDHLVGKGYSKKAAEAFTKQGWAPSGVIADGVMYENIESLGLGEKE